MPSKAFRLKRRKMFHHDARRPDRRYRNPGSHRPSTKHGYRHHQIMRFYRHARRYPIVTYSRQLQNTHQWIAGQRTVQRPQWRGYRDTSSERLWQTGQLGPPTPSVASPWKDHTSPWKDQVTLPYQYRNPDWTINQPAYLVKLDREPLQPIDGGYIQDSKDGWTRVYDYKFNMRYIFPNKHFAYNWFNPLRGNMPRELNRVWPWFNPITRIGRFLHDPGTQKTATDDYTRSNNTNNSRPCMHYDEIRKIWIPCEKTLFSPKKKIQQLAFRHKRIYQYPRPDTRQWRPYRRPYNRYRLRFARFRKRSYWWSYSNRM